MSEHIEDTAAACRQVAKACTDFAGGIDKAHHDVEHELIVLLEWTAAIEAGGLIVGIFTAGIGEGAAQAAEAARVAATASRVAKIIQTVVDLAGTLARAVSSVFSTIGKVAQRLLRIERAEVSEATVSAAAKAPEVAETAEAAAVDGLGNAAQTAESVTKKVNVAATSDLNMDDLCITCNAGANFVVNVTSDPRLSRYKARTSLATTSSGR